MMLIAIFLYFVVSDGLETNFSGLKKKKKKPVSLCFLHCADILASFLFGLVGNGSHKIFIMDAGANRY